MFEASTATGVVRERLAAVDGTHFSQAPFATRIEKPWGWELHWTPGSLPYVGKLIHIHGGARLSLQVHDEKTESWLLVSGRASVIWEDRDGALVETELRQGQGYTCRAGRRHRLVGITDCDVIEVSTAEIGTTWRLEDDYGRPDETPDRRQAERHGNGHRRSA